MFRKNERYEIESDKGFIVKRKNRDILLYIENGIMYDIQVESGLNDTAVYHNEIRIDNKKIEITQKEKERIIQNIEDALNFANIKYELIP